MIRILHMIGCLEAGGSQAMVMNLYRNIDRTKIQFDFIVDHPDRNYWENEVKSLGGKIYIMPSFRGGNIIEIRNVWKKFFVDHPEYRILHSHVRSYASIYLPIAKKYGVKTIIHSHSTSNGKGITAVVKQILQYPLRFQADYLMACSNKAGEWLYGKSVCNNNNYMVIPNSIDARKYKFNDELRNKYRKNLKLENKLVIGHIGRFHESKNHMFLLDVFDEVYKKRDDATLLLIGDGELRSQIEERILSLGLKEVVIVMGNRNDIPELMNAMDIFVFPSSWEGLGIVAIEAQASGLLVCASDQVPIETRIGDKISYLPLTLDKEIWAELIAKTPAEYERNDGVEEVCKAGYDIQDSVRRLQILYMKMWSYNE